jgi:hypothetical protein
MLVDYDAILPLPAHRVWVLEDGRTIVALLHITVKSDHVVVENLAAAPSHRGRKIGGWLMRLAEDEAQRGGVYEMRTYTHQLMVENQPSMRISATKRPTGGSRTALRVCSSARGLAAFELRRPGGSSPRGLADGAAGHAPGRSPSCSTLWQRPLSPDLRRRRLRAAAPHPLGQHEPCRNPAQVRPDHPGANRFGGMV